MELTEDFHKPLILWLNVFLLLLPLLAIGAEEQELPTSILSEAKSSFSQIDIEENNKLRQEALNNINAVPIEGATLQNRSVLASNILAPSEEALSNNNNSIQQKVSGASPGLINKTDLAIPNTSISKPKKSKNIYISTKSKDIYLFEHELNNIKEQLKEVKKTNEYRLNVTAGIGGLALAISLYNIIWTRRHKNKDTNKSLIDDFWFREIFLAHINKKMLDFRDKWSSEKVKLLRSLNDKISAKIFKELLLDLAHLRDATSAIGIINNTMEASFEFLFDSLEEQLVNKDEPDSAEEILSSGLNEMYALSFKIHTTIVKYDFDIEKIKSLDFNSPVIKTGFFRLQLFKIKNIFL